MNNKTVSVEISGKEKQVLEILTMLRYIQWLGDIGHSTSFKVFVDGDGAARMKCDFKDFEKEILTNNMKIKLNNIDKNIIKNVDINKFILE